ncbi:FAD-containing monooxygenase EthA [Rhizobium rhizogenes]|uniref:FAD-containing monooxygenase EthA n=1 Tax=Rhizobium rhizogenes TaxID=359 RepID=A0AAN2AAR1_RHIRH|nr:MULTISPECIES: NAD(P)/FAD-dependent oxidoreductase [Rhizobium/Agrobacterium group]AQS63403.1 NAD(P)/FAD-dependent oxidoreductase [Rhizobium rhizogenes]MCZ7445857.1 NAD(P)/FAD-dependent oxidoreductase [Rhizobium rhizogenes]NSZ81958.1 NAD(P)/FAD-dependent oxidoreductase [Agrobacterium tumefaciens]OAM63060.1 FAD-containing monooxygenase EthA [Rhizobium rhizogenes]CAD0216687.1 FAD-containing monooxygenase EthA [Rhizobium rhizogenes]
MNEQTSTKVLSVFNDDRPEIEHFDVLIVGAGISGIGSAARLVRDCPWASFAVLDALDGHGGTWRSNSFPGARSDSDLFTYAYSFKPWEGPPIARRDAILDYLNDVIGDYSLHEHIRYGHKVLRAVWSTTKSCWFASVRTANHDIVTIKANFLWMCQGYYRHLEGHIPDWPGLNDFRGDIIHPQRWPKDYAHTGKRIVVVGSGATAATLLPALAEEAEHVVQLQRSPSYYFASPNEYPLATQLRQLDIPKEWIHEILRQQLQKEHSMWVRHSLDNPEVAAREMLDGVREALGGTLPDDFIPRYKPWRQRVSMIPDGDFFNAINSGKADVVTGEIERLTESGILLKSGELLETDVIITATGFNINPFGDIEIARDGDLLDITETVTYRGLMFTDIPNLAWIAGYFRSASYTMRTELVGDLVTRLLNEMHEKDLKSVVPKLREEDQDMKFVPFLDTEEWRPGYVVRAGDTLPKSGNRDPWRHTQEYNADKAAFAVLEFATEPLVFE